MRHLIDPLDFSVSETEKLLSLAEDIFSNIEKYKDVCAGKILATLFYEPSTRTRLSFESAMLRLGGKCLGFAGADNSSAAKGESVADTIRMVACYSDIIAMRHNKEGAPAVAANFSHVPIINAGDGGHQHPTQTFTDLLTIKHEIGRLGNITVGLCGDLKFGRTVHSLIKSLARYKGIHFVFISPQELKVPSYVIQELGNTQYKEVETMDEVIANLDVLYMTRVQKERFFNEEDYIRLKDFYILDEAKMKMARDNLIVMHPLPRVNEISPKIDNDDRAVYFRQAQNGVYVRMALIMTLLGLTDESGCEHA